MYNFYKFGVCVPKVKIADCQANAKEIFEQIKLASDAHVQIIIFPQLALTGVTCLDLFKQSDLINSAKKNFNALRDNLANLNIIYALGLPLHIQNSLFNCIALCQGQKILGIVPKIYLSDTDARYFSPGKKNFSTTFHDESLADYEIPFGDLNFFINQKFLLKINFDTAFSNRAAINLNFASAPAQFDSDSEEIIIKGKCAENKNACLYVNPGFGESSSDFVYNGNSFIYESHLKLASTQKYSIHSQLIFQDIDFDSLKKNLPLFENLSPHVYVTLPQSKILTRSFPKNPFISNCKNFFPQIISALRNAIATRLMNINCNSIVLGLSGGLDSTLALLSSVFAFDYLNINRRNIFAVSMPGFGTTSNTFNNSKSLSQYLNVSSKIISISDACKNHFIDIDHDFTNSNVTFENAQARERSQILFDLANDLNAIVIGTGDMSEEALGFATYNGDHISNYNPNANLPKTVVRELISFISEENYLGNEVSQCLKNILDTPISPELLPTDENGNCIQHTENIVGPYELIDFFIYYLIKFGYSREKIIFMAENTFDKYTNDDIQKYFDQFYKRFIKQQFKRSCANDGPQIFSFGFSPRNSFLMPSDV